MHKPQCYVCKCVWDIYFLFYPMFGLWYVCFFSVVVVCQPWLLKTNTFHFSHQLFGDTLRAHTLVLCSLTRYKIWHHQVSKWFTHSHTHVHCCVLLTTKRNKICNERNAFFWQTQQKRTYKKTMTKYKTRTPKAKKKRKRNEIHEFYSLYLLTDPHTHSRA